MDWLFLLLAGICEIGWPIGLKLATQGSRLWCLSSILAMALSGIFLFFAQKTIPMGTAYAIWTGIGAVGAFVVGITWFKDPATIARMVSVTFIIIGMLGLKLST